MLSNNCSLYAVHSLIEYNFYYKQLARGIFYSIKRLHFQVLWASPFNHTPQKFPPLPHNLLSIITLSIPLQTTLFPTIFTPIQFHNISTISIQSIHHLYQSLQLYISQIIHVKVISFISLYFPIQSLTISPTFTLITPKIITIPIIYLNPAFYPYLSNLPINQSFT